MAQGVAHGPHWILYDGDCGLCSRAVGYIESRDRLGQFRFIPLGSAASNSMLAAAGPPESLPDSLLVFRASDSTSRWPLAKSRAVLFILREMGGRWKAVASLGLLPRWLLDWGYDRIARNRQMIAGSAGTCALPGAAHFAQPDRSADGSMLPEPASDVRSGQF